MYNIQPVSMRRISFNHVIGCGITGYSSQFKVCSVKPSCGLSSDAHSFVMSFV